MSAPSHTFGDLYMPSDFLPGFEHLDSYAGLTTQRLIGCLDAPRLLPAGACQRHELSDKSYSFQAQQLWMRD